MDFTAGILSRNLATKSNFTEFRDSRDFHVFRGNGGSAGHLAYFEWLKRCHASYVELVKHELNYGTWVDTWHDAIG